MQRHSFENKAAAQLRRFWARRNEGNKSARRHSRAMVRSFVSHLRLHRDCELGFQPEMERADFVRVRDARRAELDREKGSWKNFRVV